MGQLLVAVKSCHRDRKAGFHDAIRGTWGKEFGPGAVVKFFMGKNPDEREGSPLKNDEVVLDCLDDYMSLPFKTREICGWQRSRLLDYTFLCDCDTIVQAKKLLALPYKSLDYGGYFRGDDDLSQTFRYEDHIGVYPECHHWASGGLGYFLSKDAANEVADVFPGYWAEDLFVGQVIGPLAQKGILRTERLDMMSAVWHFRKSKKFPDFTPELLYRMHREGGPEKIYEEARAAQ
jgi:hypothetical protein